MKSTKLIAILLKLFPKREEGDILPNIVFKASTTLVDTKTRQEYPTKKKEKKKILGQHP